MSRRSAITSGISLTELLGAYRDLPARRARPAYALRFVQDADTPWTDLRTMRWVSSPAIDRDAEQSSNCASKEEFSGA
jgi:hypothetical protein